MKKNIAIIVSSLTGLIIGLLIGRFTATQFISNKENNTNNQQVSQADYFSKKQECQKYRDEVEGKVKAEDNSIPETDTSIFNSLDTIFYSPKVNSCLYVHYQATWIKNIPTFDSYDLRDALTGKIISSRLLERGSKDYFAKKNEFEDLVKTYE
jgi:hypothetical protein